MSLVYYLTYGMWPASFARQSASGRVVTTERQYDENWNAFYSETNQELSSLAFTNLSSWPIDVRVRRAPQEIPTAGGKERLVTYEVCDCHRVNIKKQINSTENRHYRLLPYSKRLQNNDMQE